MKYTFEKLPENLEEMKKLENFSLETPYGAAAFFIVALCRFVESKIDGIVMSNDLKGPVPLSRYDEAFLWDQMYELKGDKIVKIEQKSYNINNFRRRIVAAVVQPLNLYEKADSKEPMQVLEPGDRILFMETNIKDWIKVKNFDADKTGYLRLVGGDDYQMVFYQQEDLYPRDMLANLPDWG